MNPFVEEAARVYFAVRAGRSFINDKSTELASLYRMVQKQNPEFLRKAWEMEHCWGNAEPGHGRLYGGTDGYLHGLPKKERKNVGTSCG